MQTTAEVHKPFERRPQIWQINIKTAQVVITIVTSQEQAFFDGIFVEKTGNLRLDFTKFSTRKLQAVFG